MRLARSRAQGAVITLTPLVDVMLILLVFFMVTSTYLDLAMIPAGEGAEEPAGGAATVQGDARSLLLRIDASGQAVLRGRALGPGALEAELRAALAAAPALNVLILPSGLATAQDLVTTLEAVTRAGVETARIVRVEASP